MNLQILYDKERKNNIILKDNISNKNNIINNLKSTNSNLIDQLKQFNSNLNNHITKLNKSGVIDINIPTKNNLAIYADELENKTIELNAALKKLDIYQRDNAILRKKLDVPSSDKIIDLDIANNHKDKQIQVLQEEIKTLNKLMRQGDKISDKKKTSAELCVEQLEKEVVILKEQIRNLTGQGNTLLPPPIDSKSPVYRNRASNIISPRQSLN